MKKLKFAPRKDFWLFIALGIIAVLVALVLAPFWQNTNVFFSDWGVYALKIMIAICLLAYISFCLAPKIIRGGRNVVTVLTVIESVCLLFVALGCILAQFNVINISGACSIFGLCLFFRGTVEIFRAYYYRGGESRPYPVWQLVIAIAMLSFGTYCFAKQLLSDTTILWIFVVFILVVGALLITYGAVCSPKKLKKTKNSKEA